MRIIRADTADSDIFSPEKLAFGACCFFTEDRNSTYFFEIHGQKATLFPEKNVYIAEVIREFLAYSNFICEIYDSSGNILLKIPQKESKLLDIRKIQPSQFYINGRKLANCQNWIKTRKDIFIPVTAHGGKIIALDGHSRLKAAAALGFDTVFVYEDETEEYIFDFAIEAEKRRIYSVFDMEILTDEEYTVKWREYCQNFFGTTT
ncbi:MAG: ParB/RepB/Spo0J family partition protein [Turicibacter sp.]|nr:ParB/RepB/Spo0J family partition protein [Turicibacter sp.]